ncbi:peptidylprolyl isomerase [Jannaschia seohaensis]|uniref:Parvulin-like PPIase n=1 Tax=Jannaschia seohaensis TaxID=475081 RepID=A0A2Y9A1J0_9RHOB|nr:peptidylprolyl isomerase [Jannaschia seohaensis]PWJ22133.1 peptidyl-prolyl cis-trans isomerase C [Jannaschia seohaensis]SSA38411.1 peptidyl-prolyl cis-trans isomerase C [Jannaschia seohaensis]
MTRLMTSAALVLALAAPAAAQDADTVLATVDGTEITLGHLIAMRARLPQQYQQLPDQVLYDGMLEQLIQQQVLADAARADMAKADELGLENEQRAFLAGRVIDRAATAPLEDGALQALYDETYGSAEPETEWNASHILVASEEEAQALVERLEGGADFAELARAESTGPSGPNGGALGWFGAGMMVPEFEAAVQGLEAGAVSAPVQTQFGWHVVKLNETRQKDAPPLEQVRAELESQLQSAAVDAEVSRLTEAANVTRAEVEIDPALIRDGGLLE